MIVTDRFDVIVVGAGHAGCEAAFAAARLGVARRPLHALDRHRRPHAVQSSRRWHCQRPSGPRDRCAGRVDGSGHRRHRHPVQAAEPEPRTSGLVAAGPGGQEGVRRVGARLPWTASRTSTGSSAARDASLSEQGRVVGPRSRGRRTCSHCSAVVVTTGTFLNGLIHIGPEQHAAGRAGEPPSADLAESLKSFGFAWGRLKTGTPPRLDRSSIDFDAGVARGHFALEPGDASPGPVFISDDHDRSAAGAVLPSPHERPGSSPRSREHRPIAAVQRPDSAESARDTARRSKTRWSASPRRSGTRSFSSRRASTRRRSTSTGSR